MAGPCMVCRAPLAPFAQAWPGASREQPEAVRGKPVTLCALYGPCHAKAVARFVKATNRPWPWFPHNPPEFRALVADLLGEVAPAPRRATAPKPSPAAVAQGSLF